MIMTLNERCENTLDSLSRMALRDALIIEAATMHAPYPQYSGYFDDWVLCLITQETRFKGSSYFPEGRIVLASPTVQLLPGIPASRRTYCVDTSSVCATPHESIQPLT